MRGCRAWLNISFLAALITLASISIWAQEWSGYVTADDGTGLATDVYLPLGTGPWPVVVTRTPYDKSNPGHYPDWCRTLNQHGYACVAQDCRGSSASQGSDTVFHDAGRDGRRTVEWIAGQPWCNGAIASVGGSAMGIPGYAMAQGAPPELRCLVAAIAPPDLYDHAFAPGGAVRWELISNWLASHSSAGMLDQFLAHRIRDDSPWWRDYDWLSDPETIQVEALHFGGWWDMYSQGALDGFRRYQHRGGGGARDSQHLVIGPWVHHSLATGWLAQDNPLLRETGELSFPANAFPPDWPFAGGEWQLLLDWLGHCLRDEPTPAASWPAARVYLMGAVGEVGAPGNRWVDLDDWPPPSTPTRHYLTASGALQQTSVEPGEQVLAIDPANPVPTLGGANLYYDIEVEGRQMGRGSHDQREIEARSDVLVFTSQVLTQPVTVMGRVGCRLWIRPDTPDLDLSVRLTDVYPDGRSMHVLDGTQRARMRCGTDRECFLEPGVASAIEVDLWSTAMVFNAGHRIRVAVAGSNWPRFEVNTNSGGDLDTGTPIPAHPALLFGPEHPSALVLPVVRPPRRPTGRLP